MIPQLKRATLGASAAFLLLMIASGAHASNPTVSIQSLSPGNTISIGTPVTFAVATTGFVNPMYSLSDTFVDGSLGNVDLSSAGEFSWTPASNDIGSHTVTITVTDNSGDEATAAITLDVIDSAVVSIESVSPSTSITTGQTITFDTSTSGFSETPTYSLSDSFSGSTLSSSDINSSGYVSWTPAASDAGTHTVTVTATDSSGHTGRDSVTFEITNPVTTPVTTSPVTTPVTAVVSTPAPVVETPAPVIPATTFTETLSEGSKDAQVTALQQLLAAQGDFSANVTGYFGPETKTAVMQFQAAHSIQQLGIVGPSTRAALNEIESQQAQEETTTPAASSATGGSLTLSQVQTEIQSIASQLTLVESQLSDLVGH